MRIFWLSLLCLLCGCRVPPPRPGAEVYIPSVREKQIYVVIDDLGLSMEQAQRFLDIPVPMTLAVLPQRKKTAEVCAAIARSPGKEIILHQPMEPKNQSNPGGGCIFDDTPPAEAVKIMDMNLATVSGAKGMNNHMGSCVSENPEVMRTVLQYCKAHNLFYLDSKTAYHSAVKRIAAEEGMHFEERHVFLDIQHDREYIRRMWNSAVEKAGQNGYVIAIGHVWSAETAAAIADSVDELKAQGYTFHRLSELYE